MPRQSNMAGTSNWLVKNNLKALIKAFSEAPTAPGNGIEETANETRAWNEIISIIEYVFKWKAL